MNVSLSDDDLVKSILNGNDGDFSQLYERYRHQVRSAAFRILQNSEEAQDATQEIFIKIYRALRTWDVRKSKLSTWINRLAINHSIDCCRVRCRRAEYQLSDKNAERILWAYSLHAPNRSPFRDVKAKEDIEAVRHCIVTLPALQKNTFIQRYFQEKKLVEIAEIERCKLATVKTSLYRATKSVREGLLKSRRFSLYSVQSPA